MTSKTGRSGATVRALAASAALQKNPVGTDVTHVAPPWSVTTSAAVAQWPSPSKQIPGAPVHSLSAVHPRHDFVVASQMGVAAAHWELLTQPTHFWVIVSQTVLPVAVHSVPLAASVPRHSTHLCATVSHTGFVPPQCGFIVHSTHAAPPSLVPQAGVPPSWVVRHWLSLTQTDALATDASATSASPTSLASGASTSLATASPIFAVSGLSDVSGLERGAVVVDALQRPRSSGDCPSCSRGRARARRAQSGEARGASELPREHEDARGDREDPADDRGDAPALGRVEVLALIGMAVF